MIPLLSPNVGALRLLSQQSAESDVKSFCVLGVAPYYLTSPTSTSGSSPTVAEKRTFGVL
jgi:hypothetical protein